MTVPADTSSLAELRQQVRARAIQLGASDDMADQLVLVVSELATNVIMHAHDEHVSVGVDVESRSWVVEVTGADALADSGGRTAPAATAVDGRGLFLVNAIMDEVDIVASTSGSAVRCVKHQVA